jgi:hypothetical protein
MLHPHAIISRGKERRYFSVQEARSNVAAMYRLESIIERPANSARPVVGGEKHHGTFFSRAEDRRWISTPAPMDKRKRSAVI